MSRPISIAPADGWFFVHDGRTPKGVLRVARIAAFALDDSDGTPIATPLIVGRDTLVPPKDTGVVVHETQLSDDERTAAERWR